METIRQPGFGPIENKRVLIMGLARSGRGAALLVRAHGGIPVLYDRKPKEHLGDPSVLEGLEGMETHLGEAIEPLLQTCDAAVFSPGIPPDAPDMVKARAALPMEGEMEFAFPFISCPVYAVTGTNGKTTVTAWLSDMLEKAGHRAFAAGNIGYALSLAALEAGENDRVVAEVSSFQLESTKAFHPRIAAVLNITPDHLDRHGGMERYIGLKRHIFSCMDERDTAVLNRGDALVAAFAEGLAPRVVWFSASGEVESGAFLRDGHIVLRFDGEERALCPAADIRLPGGHNIENALAAAAMALSAGVPAAVIRHSLRTFEGVEHRMETVAAVDGVRYINDSKGTNPDSTVKAVEAMDTPTVLILGGYDKHVPLEKLVASVAASPFIRHVVTMGQTGPQLFNLLRGAGFKALTGVTTLDEAVDCARRAAVPGDTVLFSPASASWDQFPDFETRGRIFKKLVLALNKEA